MSNSSQFIKCLRPFVLWVRILGIDLSDDGKTTNATSKKKKWFMICYAATCLLANIASQLNAIIYIFFNLSSFSLDGKKKFDLIRYTMN